MPKHSAIRPEWHTPRSKQTWDALAGAATPLHLNVTADIARHVRATAARIARPLIVAQKRLIDYDKTGFPQSSIINWLLAAA